jgi:hypothetical protein
MTRYLYIYGVKSSLQRRSDALFLLQHCRIFKYQNVWKHYRDNKQQQMNNNKCIVLILIIVAASITNIHSFCGDGTQFGNLCYKTVYNYVSWRDAKDYCINWGGNLATAVDINENALIASLAPDTDVAWIGLTKLGKTSYYWSDNSAFTLDQWDAGKPDNVNDKEECGQLITSQTASNFGKWNDADCLVHKPFICKRDKCNWAAGVDVATYGGPKPTAELTTDGTDIVLKVAMASKNSVAHFVSLTPIETCSDMNNTAKTIYSNQDNQYGKWVAAVGDCQNIYTLRMSIVNFVKYPGVMLKKLVGSDIFEARADVFMDYIDTEKGPCTLTAYSTPVALRLYLNANSFSSSMNGQQVDLCKLVVNSIRLNDLNLVEFNIVVVGTVPGELKDFSCYKPDPLAPQKTTEFRVASDTSVCDVDGICKSQILLVATEVMTDYSGPYVLTAKFEKQGFTDKPVTLDFSIVYQVPTPPTPAATEITTTTALYDSNFEAQKEDFVVTDRALAIVSMNQQIEYTDTTFSVKNAYICCMYNRNPMPAFDPSKSQYGCRNQTDDMSFWAQLFSNGVEIKQDFDVSTMPLEFSPYQYGYSFSLLPLSGDYDQLCYLHTESTFVDTGSRRSLQEDHSHDYLSWTPMQIKQDGQAPGAVKAGVSGLTASDIGLISGAGALIIILVLIICCFCFSVCCFCFMRRSSKTSPEEKQNTVIVVEETRGSTEFSEIPDDRKTAITNLNLRIPNPVDQPRQVAHSPLVMTDMNMDDNKMELSRNSSAKALVPKTPILENIDDDDDY